MPAYYLANAVIIPELSGKETKTAGRMDSPAAGGGVAAAGSLLQYERPRSLRRGVIVPLNKRFKLLGGQGLRIVISLHLMAVMRGQKIQLLFRFHAFRNNPKVQAMPHIDNRFHDGRIARDNRDLLSERLVNLEFVPRETLQVTQAG